jgi:cytidylate kinase
MDSHLFKDLVHTPEVIERQLNLWNSLRQAAREKNRKGSDSPFRFVTIARDQGCLEDEISQELSRQLGWHVFDSEIVASIAQNSHVSENLVRQLDEKSQSIFEDTIERLFRIPEYASFGHDEYSESLLKTLVCLAATGSAILVGRGANFVLKDDAEGLKILLIASPEVRVRRLSQIWKVSAQEARHRMHAEDEEQRRFTQHYFNLDFDDFRFYDIIFNTDHVSAKQVAASIQAYMNNGKAQRLEAQRRMVD